MVLAENEHKSGFITLIDFEKAFDSIEWPFLFKCLKKFNFGDNFISWIRILYTNIKSCVGNNGYYSDKFDVLRSVRQGCPISALQFILVAEILAINVRENDEIRGITYNNRSFQITQLADDTTLFLADLESVVISISLFQTFASVSGLTLNLDKSEIIPLGENVHKNITLPQELKKLRYNNGAFKTLGGPRWQSGNTLASHLCGRGSIPVMAVSGKAGSCLPLVGSLQYTTLANSMYWFPLPFQLPVVI